MILAKQRKKVDTAKYTPGTMSHSHSKSIKNNNLFHQGCNGQKCFGQKIQGGNYLYMHFCTDSLLEAKVKPLSHYKIRQQVMEDDEYNYDGYNESFDPECSDGAVNEPENSHEPQMEDVLCPIDQELPFEILPLVRLYSQLNHILEEIQSLVCLDKGWCLILLRDFKWDKEYLREEYYNNNEKYLRNAGFSADLSRPIDNPDVKVGVCEVCYMQKVALHSNICGHSFCMECWMSHLKNSILSGSVFPRCMDYQCGKPVLLETIIGLLQRQGQEGAYLLKKYEKKVCESFITTNRNYQFCTGADCGNCIKINHPQDTVQCNCGKIFCFRCQSDDHYPCKCAQKAKWAQQVVKEQADAKWISQNAKICPSCRKAVERSMGCNFMVCKCGKSFCYMCSQPWQPDHKDHFRCHIYQKKPDDEVNREREVMEKMNHCTQRYIFNQGVANKYKEIDVFAKRKYLFKTINIDLTQSEFMENAFKFTIQCCEKLKWIYAFTYFQDLKEFKEVFECSLGQYEKYKENLLKLLAVDLKNYFSQIQSQQTKGELNQPQKLNKLCEQFKALKKQIVNYYTSTKKYKEKFVEQLKHITMKLQEEKQRAEIEEYRKQERWRDVRQVRLKQEVIQVEEKGLRVVAKKKRYVEV